MKYFDDVKYPSMSMDNEDISEESIYRSVDELLKSHLYSAKTALPCMGSDKLILWVDYDFFEIKRIAEKRSCERVEISEDGVTGEKKTRKFFIMSMMGMRLRFPHHSKLWHSYQTEEYPNLASL